MADSRKSRIVSRSNLQAANFFVVILVVLTLAFILLLYTGMVSTRKSLDTLSQSQTVSDDVVANLEQHYQRERTVDLVLIVVSVTMGVALFIIYRYLVRVTETLREVRTIDRDILNSITRGIVTVNLQGEITSCNRAFEEILKLNSEKVVGCFPQEVFSKDDPLCLLLQESIVGEARPQDRDLPYTLRSGTIIPLRVTTFALENELGQRVGGILLVKDMTEIRKMEERIQRASRLAALGQLTQRLVHEIRNPLSAMDINLQLLRERLDTGSNDPEIGRYLNIITTETRRLNKVLRDAQMFAQPQPPAMATIDLHEVIRQVLLLIDKEAISKGVEIADNLNAEQSLVLGDTDQLKQVFINLFKNSIEAMAGGGKMEVISRNGAQGKIVGLELVDTGSGIPMSNFQRIFDPYFTTKKKGTGLGLSVVHNIVTQHGGSIDVSSWLGEGTIFSIIMPVAARKEQDSGDAKAENSHRR